MLRHSNKVSFLSIGCFSKPFGIKGLVHFFSYSGEYAHLNAIRNVYLEDLSTMYVIEYWVQSSRSKCKIEGVHTPEQAKMLCGKSLFAPRNLVVPLYEDEYYFADLIGLSVLCNGQKIGIIENISDSGVSPLFSIRWSNGTQGYIPFNQHFFGVPDIEMSVIPLLNEQLVEHT